jgi:hypothetical protein
MCPVVVVVLCPFKANQLILERIKKGTFSTITSAMAHPQRQPGKWTVKSSNNNPCTRSRPRIKTSGSNEIPGSRECQLFSQGIRVGDDHAR